MFVTETDTIISCSLDMQPGLVLSLSFLDVYALHTFCFYIPKNIDIYGWDIILMIKGLYETLSINNTLCRVPLCWVPRVICCYAECRFAECHFAECRFAECRFAECRFAECRGAIYGLANPCVDSSISIYLIFLQLINTNIWVI